MLAHKTSRCRRAYILPLSQVLPYFVRAIHYQFIKIVLRTNILLSLTKLQLSPKPVNITFVNFAVSGLILIRQLPVPLLPLSFTPNLITVILSTINSVSLNYPVDSRLQQIQNSLAVMKAPKSCHITPILRSLHWLRITERIEYKLLSPTYKVLTTIQPQYLETSSPFNVLAVLALHPSLLSLGHFHHPL